jgi:uncharacterized protein
MGVTMKKNIIVLFLGIYFGIILTKGEVISWFRVQEMFRFQSFHMYGFIGSAVATAAISIIIMKKLQLKDLYGNLITPIPLTYQHGNIIGGIIFGLGWALIGACPGPIFTLLGSGYMTMLIPLVGATLGTYVYGVYYDKLPH